MQQLTKNYPFWKGLRVGNKISILLGRQLSMTVYKRSNTNKYQKVLNDADRQNVTGEQTREPERLV